MKNINALRGLIAYHDDLYYNQDTPELTDDEYDALKAQLAEEETVVPGAPSVLFETVRHAYPIKSLAKVNTEAELRKMIEPLLPVVVEPKLDGLTLVVHNSRAVTRGNGFEGEDVTHTARMIPGMDKLLDSNYAYPIRGEVVMHFSELERVNQKRIAAGKEPMKNTRNAAAGMIRNKDAEKVDGVVFYMFDVIGDTRPMSEKNLSLLLAGSEKCQPASSMRFTETEEAVEYILNYDRTKLSYEIDGLVIKSDQHDSLKKFGETGHHPKDAFAWKFATTGVWTRLKDVIWQTGRTGKITPVALIEPTEILGSTVSRVTLHNIGIMNALGISKGCEVLLIKANDVIPRIIEVRGADPDSRIPLPVSCAVCGGELEQINDQQFCQNIMCGSKLQRNVQHIAKRDALDIEGLSEETIRKLIEAGYVERPFDLFSVTEKELLSLEGFAQKSANNVYTAIQAAKNPPLDRFIYAAGIPNLGRTLSREVAEEFGTIGAFLCDIGHGCPRFSAMDGVGPVIVENVQSNVGLLTALLARITPQSTEPKGEEKMNNEVMTIVVTGTLERPRGHYEDMIRAAGHKVSGSVTKSTSLLLVGEKAGSKLAKAQKLGIPIIYDETELQGFL